MRNLILPLIIALLTFSCKKKKEETTASSSNNTTTTTGGTSNGGLYNGNFSAEKYVQWYNGVSTSPLYQTKVWLAASAQTETLLSVYASNLGIVKSNGIQLQYHSPIKIYMDSTGALTYSSQVNFEHNSASLGNINFTNTDTFPRYTPALALAIEDTVDKTKDYIVPLTNLSYFNKVFVSISNPSNPSVFVSKTASFGAADITFTSSDLSVLPTGSGYKVRLLLRKLNDQTINGKLFRFENNSYNDFWVYVK